MVNHDIQLDVLMSELGLSEEDFQNLKSSDVEDSNETAYPLDEVSDEIKKTAEYLIREKPEYIKSLFVDDLKNYYLEDIIKQASENMTPESWNEYLMAKATDKAGVTHGQEIKDMLSDNDIFDVEVDDIKQILKLASAQTVHILTGKGEEPEELPSEELEKIAGEFSQEEIREMFAQDAGSMVNLDGIDWEEVYNEQIKAMSPEDKLEWLYSAVGDENLTLSQ